MKRSILMLAVLALLFCDVGQTEAGFTQLLTNGDFESGTFNGWTVQNHNGSMFSNVDWKIDTPGTDTPISGNHTMGNVANNGSYYAVADQSGIGTQALLQSFTVPVNVASLTLTFDMFANNYKPDGTTNANQQARVDILSASADALSTSPGDIVGTYYVGADSGANPHAFTSYSHTLTGLTAGTTYRLRFYGAANERNLNIGVDNVSIRAEISDVSAVPEPSTLTLLGVGAIGLVGYGWHRRRQSV